MHKTTTKTKQKSIQQQVNKNIIPQTHNQTSYCDVISARMVAFSSRTNQHRK